MWTFDFVVALESMIVQYPAPGVCQTTVPHRTIGVMVASKYEILIVLGQCRETLGEKWLVVWSKSRCPGWNICIYIYIYTAVTSSAVSCVDLTATAVPPYSGLRPSVPYMV